MPEIDQGNRLRNIREVLEEFNKRESSSFVLKGGTALAICYGLDRFSEDIDFDSTQHTRGRFLPLVEEFCARKGYSFRVGKDTETVQRVFIDYGDEGHPLKIETSYRKREIDPKSICRREGILVYTLDELAKLKAAAYLSRDKIRDLYDAAFICTHFFDDLDASTKDSLRHAFEYKDLNQFDYIVRTQDDPFIDVEMLEDMFLESFDKLGLMRPSDADRGNR